MADLHSQKQKLKRLTQRERDVLRLRCEGKKLAEIAKELVVAKTTVNFHIANIYEKLEINELESPHRILELFRFCESLNQISEEEFLPQIEADSIPEEPSQYSLMAVEEDEIVIAGQDSALQRIPTLGTVPRFSRSRWLASWAILLLTALIAGLVGAGAMFMILQPQSMPSQTTLLTSMRQSSAFSSNFDGIDQEGWKVSTGGETHPRIAGNGGGTNNGFLQWQETQGGGDTSYYVAPSTFHGDWTSYSMLRIDLQSSGGIYFTSGNGAHGDIYLRNGTLIAQYSLPRRPSTTWDSFDIPLTNDGQWILGGGATRLEDVLKNVTVFEIRAEYGRGLDSSGLDNVRLLPR